MLSLDFTILCTFRYCLYVYVLMHVCMIICMYVRMYVHIYRMISGSVLSCIFPSLYIRNLLSIFLSADFFVRCPIVSLFLHALAFSYSTGDSLAVL